MHIEIAFPLIRLVQSLAIRLVVIKAWPSPRGTFASCDFCFCQCSLNPSLAQSISLILDLEYPESSWIGLAAFSIVRTSVPLVYRPRATESPV
jgi:hypothetical protein